MSYKYWIKLYHETLDDAKLGKLDDHLWRRTIEMFLLAGDQNEGGFLPKLEDMAWRLRTEEQDLEGDLRRLESKRIIEKRDDRWFVIKFAEHQAPMSDKERKRRERTETGYVEF